MVEGSTTFVESSGGEATSGVAETSFSSSSSSSGVADSTTGFVSHCEVPPDQPPACWDEICELFVCGHPGGLYDDDGCPRSLCESDSDCRVPAFCHANIVAVPCTFAQLGWASCEGFADSCVCGDPLSCGPDPRGLCLHPSEIVVDDVCLASDRECDVLDEYVAETHQALVDISDEMSEQLLAQARECQWLRIGRLSDECGVAPCDLLCEVLPSWIGCRPQECSSCADADPAEVLELLQALVDRSLPCADCALCDELQSEICAAITAC